MTYLRTFDPPQNVNPRRSLHFVYVAYILFTFPLLTAHEKGGDNFNICYSIIFLAFRCCLVTFTGYVCGLTQTQGNCTDLFLVDFCNTVMLWILHSTGLQG